MRTLKKNASRQPAGHVLGYGTEKWVWIGGGPYCEPPSYPECVIGALQECVYGGSSGCTVNETQCVCIE